NVEVIQADARTVNLPGKFDGLFLFASPRTNEFTSTESSSRYLPIGGQGENSRLYSRQFIFPFGSPMSDLTRILSAIEQGDPHAAEQLLPLVYDELRRLAAQKLAQEAPGQTLQATALVHEAYLRLVMSGSRGHDPPEGRSWDGRRHFFAAAAEAMRRILI